MMNYIWVGLVVIAVVAGAVTGTMELVLNNIFDFASTAVDICLGLNLSRFDRHHGILLRTDEGHGGFRTLRKAGQSHRTGDEKAVPGSSG